MQFASFDLAHPVYECLGRRLSFQLVTLENLYGTDPARTGERPQAHWTSNPRFICLSAHLPIRPSDLGNERG